jgi:hypothetical protein
MGRKKKIMKNAGKEEIGSGRSLGRASTPIYQMQAKHSMSAPEWIDFTDPWTQMQTLL